MPRGQPRLGLLLRHPWSLCWHGRQDWRVVAPRLTRAKNRPPNSGSTPRPPARVANQNPRATSPTKSVHSPSNIRALGFVPELRRRGNFPHRTFLSECAGCRAFPRLFARRTYRISASGRCILPSTLRWGHPPHPRQHDRSSHQPSFPPQTAWPTLALSNVSDVAHQNDNVAIGIAEPAFPVICPRVHMRLLKNFRAECARACVTALSNPVIWNRSSTPKP